MSIFEIVEVGRPDSDYEISKERQEFLAERRKIKPDYRQDIYPFKDIKLKRADIEWLLATHESKGIRGANRLERYKSAQK